MGNDIYRGRFAPSPTGPLHAGSLVAALASWLDARANNGSWLVRVEDVDLPRTQPGAARHILHQLSECSLVPDEPPVYQSRRGDLYQRALDQLIAQGMAYPCGCTRQDIAQALAATGQQRARHGELVYPGTCRHGLAGRPVRSWRFQTDFSGSKMPLAFDLPGHTATEFIAADKVYWTDRRLGAQSQHVISEVGDFTLQRADGLWAYQLAVVVDDAAQGITHVVRGEDLANNTPRQMLLQEALDLPRPVYLHTPLVLGADGEKLSKQHGAQPLDTDTPLQALRNAGTVLGLEVTADSVEQWLKAAIPEWALLVRESAPPGQGLKR